ncbi:MAG: hypothetical protein IPM51_08620 [Sphingobacteriaceae bacterium]|nr:hypothetical protein [Sphingobacteriaceae bacterium]
MKENSVPNLEIVLLLSQSQIEIEGLHFSRAFKEENNREPFNFNLGYISLEGKNLPDMMVKVTETLAQLLKEFESNEVALCNLFILTTRMDFSGEGQEQFVDQFVKALPLEKREKIYSIMVKEIAKNYYSHTHISKKNPSTVSEWLDLFNQAQYLHGFSDLSQYCYTLVKEDGKPLRYDYVKQLSPLLRATMYHDFELTPEELKDLIGSDSNEVSFLVASMLEKTDGSGELPSWLNKELIDYIFKNKNSIAQHTIYYLFGFIRYESKRNTPIYERFRDLMKAKLRAIVTKKDESLNDLINALNFPVEFLSFLSFLESLKIDLHSIEPTHFETIAKKFVASINKVKLGIPEDLANRNYTDRFNLYYLDEPKYRAGITLLSVSLLHLKADENKQLTDLFYDFKPLYFGGYEAKAMAVNFTEFIFLTFFAIENVSGLNPGIFSSYKDLVSKFSEILLYPYVLEAERDSYMWDQSENQLTKQNFSKYLVNLSLKNIHKKECKYQLWDQLHSDVNSFKTAEWPFQRHGFNLPKEKEELKENK